MYANDVILARGFNFGNSISDVDCVLYDCIVYCMKIKNDGYTPVNVSLVIVPNII